MAGKIDATRWTGLAPDGAHQDVCAAQNPVAGKPEPLDPQVFKDRVINWPNLIFLIPIWFAITLTSDNSMVSALILGVVYVGVFVIVSLFVNHSRRRSDRPDPLILDQDGLYLSREYMQPIPWSRIGRIEFTSGRFVGLVRVEIDRQHKLVRRPPWPFSAGNGATEEMAEPAIILSCWQIKADGDDLIAQLERFRDNYCGA